MKASRLKVNTTIILKTSRVEKRMLVQGPIMNNIGVLVRKVVVRDQNGYLVRNEEPGKNLQRS